MAESKTYKIYTHNDIRRYWNGEMTQVEMYELEKQAIWDSFLADAVEGYHSIVREAAAADLSFLRQKLNTDAEAKVVPLAKKTSRFPWIKLAVAASVTGILVFLGINYFSGKKQESSVAANKTLSKSESTPAPAAPSVSTKQPTDSIIAFSQLSAAEKKELIKKSVANGKSNAVFVKPENLTEFYSNMEDKKEIITDELLVNPPPKVALHEKPVNKLTEQADTVKFSKETNVPGSDIATERKSSDKMPLKKQMQTEKPAPVVTNKNRDDLSYEKDVLKKQDTVQGSFSATMNAVGNNTNNELNQGRSYTESRQNNITFNDFSINKNISTQRNYRFNYKVTDVSGNHIPFTNVSVPADQLVTYTRVDGKFGLFSTDSVLKVNIKAAGYQPLTLNLRSNNNFGTITLPEEKNAGEVVVVGDMGKFKTTPKSAKLVAKLEEAEPVDGFDNYSSYLANNMNLTEKPKGEVVLSFDINKTGEPTNIVVNQSLGNTADKEAIRLLSEGPKWKTKKRKKTKGKIVINF
jgi:hypothetical protein